MKSKKDSLLVGGFISTAGIFITKLIGLFYMIPFSQLIQDKMIYYAMPFNVYSYVLNIATAGFPFAIASLVARYYNNKDYRTTLMIKNLSRNIMTLCGCISMLFMILCSNVISNIQIGKEHAYLLKNSYILLSIALFFVPVLSAGRGFYQGLKEMEIYAISQVLEQLIRVAFLLGASAIAIYVFHLNSIWAAYFGVLSTGISAIAALLHLHYYDRKKMKHLKQKAKEQTADTSHTKSALLKELFHMSFPYLLMAALGYSDMIINSLFLNKGLAAFGFESSLIESISGSINGPIQKLMSIPMVLALGFSAAIIPHISIHLANKDWENVRKNIKECLSSVLFFAIPLSFCLFVFAKPIYYVMYDGGELLPIYADILRWYALEAFINTILPIFNAFMMAGGLMRLNIRNLSIFTLIKLSLTYPFIAWLGYSGSVISTVIAALVTILLSMYALHKHFHYSFHELLPSLVKILLCSFGIYITSLLCIQIGLKGYDSSRWISFLQLGITCVISMIVYILLSCVCKLPQTIFGIHPSQLIHQLKHRNK